MEWNNNADTVTFKVNSDVINSWKWITIWRSEANDEAVAQSGGSNL